MGNLLLVAGFFATKIGPNGTIDRLKACFVAKGYTKIVGLDYDDTFSPVTKMASIRLFIAMSSTMTSLSTGCQKCFF